MSRVKSCVARKKRVKKLLKLAKGYWGERKNRYRRAKETVFRALRYATRDRKVRKREFRRLWIQRINAFLRQRGKKYSDFMGRLRKKEILLDRKILQEFAIRRPQVIEALIKEVYEGADPKN